MNISVSYKAIQNYPIIINEIVKHAKRSDHNVFVCSGYPIDKCKNVIIQYDKIFSVTDYHKMIGTKIWTDENGDHHMNKDFWNPTKGEWAKRENIDIHLDTCEEYKKYFPKSCKFFLVDDNFQNNFALILNQIFAV